MLEVSSRVAFIWCKHSLPGGVWPEAGAFEWACSVELLSCRHPAPEPSQAPGERLPCKVGLVIFELLKKLHFC